jgi:hypothetical protein
VVRLVRWYFVLPQVGQRRFDESAPVTCLVTFGWVLSSAILGVLFSSAERGTVAPASLNFSEPDDLSGCPGYGKRNPHSSQRAIHGRDRIRSRVVRLVRWYFVLPQTGQRRNPRSEESAAATCSVTFGSGFSSAVLKAPLSSAKGGALTGSFPNCDEPRDFPSCLGIKRGRRHRAHSCSRYPKAHTSLYMTPCLTGSVFVSPHLGHGEVMMIGAIHNINRRQRTPQPFGPGWSCGHQVFGEPHIWKAPCILVQNLFEMLWPGAQGKMRPKSDKKS